MPMSIRELEQIYHRTYRRLIAGILIAHGASLLIALTLLVIDPRVASWMSKVLQAQLAGTGTPAQHPVRLVQPDKDTPTIRVD